MRRVIQRQYRLGKQPPDGMQEEVGVAPQDRLVDLIQRVVPGVPPPASAEGEPVGGACLRRLGAHVAEHGGYADAPERFVAGTADPASSEFLSGMAQQRLARQAK